MAWTKEEDDFLIAHQEESLPWLQDKLKRSATNIKDARKRLGLSSSRFLDWDSISPLLMEKYKQGWNDAMLAEHVGISRSAVGHWRERNTLPANARGGEKGVKRSKGGKLSESMPPWSPSPTAPTYTEEQEAWLKTIDTFRRKYRRLPTFLEGFRLALSLGYRKDDSHVAGRQTDSRA